MSWETNHWHLETPDAPVSQQLNYQGHPQDQYLYQANQVAQVYSSHGCTGQDERHQPNLPPPPHLGHVHAPARAPPTLHKQLPAYPHSSSAIDDNYIDDYNSSTVPYSSQKNDRYHSQHQQQQRTHHHQEMALEQLDYHGYCRLHEQQQQQQQQLQQQQPQPPLPPLPPPPQQQQQQQQQELVVVARIAEIEARCLEIAEELREDLSMFVTFDRVTYVLLERFELPDWEALGVGHWAAIPFLARLHKLNTAVNVFVEAYLSQWPILSLRAMERDLVAYLRSFNLSSVLPCISRPKLESEHGLQQRSAAPPEFIPRPSHRRNEEADVLHSQNHQQNQSLLNENNSNSDKLSAMVEADPNEISIDDDVNDDDGALNCEEQDVTGAEMQGKQGQQKDIAAPFRPSTRTVSSYSLVQAGSGSRDVTDSNISTEGGGSGDTCAMGQHQSGQPKDDQHKESKGSVGRGTGKEQSIVRKQVTPKSSDFGVIDNKSHQLQVQQKQQSNGNGWREEVNNIEKVVCVYMHEFAYYGLGELWWHPRILQVIEDMRLCRFDNLQAQWKANQEAPLLNPEHFFDSTDICHFLLEFVQEYTDHQGEHQQGVSSAKVQHVNSGQAFYSYLIQRLSDSSSSAQEKGDCSYRQAGQGGQQAEECGKRGDSGEREQLNGKQYQYNMQCDAVVSLGVLVIQEDISAAILSLRHVLNAQAQMMVEFTKAQLQIYNDETAAVHSRSHSSSTKMKVKRKRPRREDERKPHPSSEGVESMVSMENVVKESEDTEISQEEKKGKEDKKRRNDVKKKVTVLVLEDNGENAREQEEKEKEEEVEESRSEDKDERGEESGWGSWEGEDGGGRVARETETSREKREDRKLARGKKRRNTKDGVHYTHVTLARSSEGQERANDVGEEKERGTVQGIEEEEKEEDGDDQMEFGVTTDDGDDEEGKCRDRALAEGISDKVGRHSEVEVEIDVAGSEEDDDKEGEECEQKNEEEEQDQEEKEEEVESAVPFEGRTTSSVPALLASHLAASAREQHDLSHSISLSFSQSLAHSHTRTHVDNSSLSNPQSGLLNLQIHQTADTRLRGDTQAMSKINSKSTCINIKTSKGKCTGMGVNRVEGSRSICDASDGQDSDVVKIVTRDTLRRMLPDDFLRSPLVEEGYFTKNPVDSAGYPERHQERNNLSSEFFGQDVNEEGSHEGWKQKQQWEKERARATQRRGEREDRYAIGRWGERLVYQYLLQAYPTGTRVEWMNRDKESKASYDFIVTLPSSAIHKNTSYSHRSGNTSSRSTLSSTSTSQRIFVEVKTTRFPERNVFELSLWEWQFATCSTPKVPYHIYRVLGGPEDLLPLAPLPTAPPLSPTLPPLPFPLLVSVPTALPPPPSTVPPPLLYEGQAAKIVIVTDVLQAIEGRLMKLCLAL